MVGRGVRVVVVGVAVMLASQPAFAQQASSIAIDAAMIAEAVEAVARDQQADAQGREAWLRDVQEAEGERDSGRKLMLYGGIGGVAAIIVGFAAFSVDPESGGRGAGAALIYAGTFGGGGVMTYGAFRYGSAKDTLEDLEREGQINGYMRGAEAGNGLRLALGPATVALTYRW